MEKEIDVNGIVVKIKEMSYLDSLSNSNEDRKEWIKKMLKISIVSPEPTDEFISKLTFKEGNMILKEINSINGLTPDFPIPSSQGKAK